MAVRNFYVRGRIDGRRTELAGGPARSDGWMQLTITQRNHGEIENAVEIDCYEDRGVLRTEVRIGDKVVGVYETER